MGIVLFLNNGKRFLYAVVLGKSLPKENSYPIYQKDTQNIIRILKGSIGVLLIGAFIFIGVNRHQSFQKQSNPLLSGVWKVTSFVKNNILYIE